MTYILGLPLVEGLPFFPQNFTKQDVGVAEAVLNFFTNFAKTGWVLYYVLLLLIIDANLDGERKEKKFEVGNK